MTGQVLDVLQRHVLAEQIRDHQDPERVRRENLRQAGRLEAAFEHQLHGERRHLPFRQRAAAPLPGAKERRSLRRIREARSFKVGRDSVVQVVTHGDLPRLAPFFRELKRPMGAVVAQVLDPEPGDGPDPGAGVDERPQDRPVLQPLRAIGPDGGEERPRLLDGRFGRPALPERVAYPSDRMKRVQHDRVARHQDVEKMLERRPRLVLGGRTPWELVQEPAGQAGGHMAQLQALILAPGEEPADLVGVGRPGVGVRVPSPEELVRREAGRLAGPHEDGRKGPRGSFSASEPGFFGTSSSGRSHACSSWSVLHNGVRGREIGSPGSLAEVDE